MSSALQIWQRCRPLLWKLRTYDRDPLHCRQSCLPRLRVFHLSFHRDSRQTVGCEQQRSLDRPFLVG